MQLQKADLSFPFYLWLARKAYVYGRTIWILYRQPKVRWVCFATLFYVTHIQSLRLLTAFRRSGLLSDPKKIQWINRYLQRTDAYIRRNGVAAFSDPPAEKP